MAVPEEWFSEEAGIKQGYPKLRRYFGHFMDYISLLRPFTLIAPLIVGLFGSLICLGSAFWSRWLQVVYVSFTLVLLQATGQVINEATGPEDRINKPYRPIPKGRITQEEAFGFGFLLALIAVWRSFMVNMKFGTWCLLLLFFAVFYNMKPFQTKKYLWVNLLWMSVSRGLLPFVVIWSAFSNPFALKPWLLGSIAFLWVFAFQPTKDLGDVEGDRMYGLRTLPVVYGKAKTRRFIECFSLLPLIPVILYVQSGLLSLPYLLLIGLVIVRQVGIWGFDKEINMTENSISWIAFYTGLSLIFLLSWVAEVIG